MGGSVSVERFVELSSEEVAQLMSQDETFAPHASNALEHHINGKLASTVAPDILADLLGMEDDEYFRRMVRRQTKPKICRVHSTFTTASSTRSLVEDHHDMCIDTFQRGLLEEEQEDEPVRKASATTAALKRLLKPKEPPSQDPGTELDTLFSEAIHPQREPHVEEDTPRCQVAFRIAPSTMDDRRRSTFNIPMADSIRESRGSIKSALSDDHPERPQSSDENDDAALKAVDAALAADAFVMAQAQEVCPVRTQVLELEKLESKVSSSKQSVIVQLMGELSLQSDGATREDFEDLCRKYDLFQKPGMEELRDSFFTLFDRDGNGRCGVDEVAGAFAIFHEGSKKEKLELIFQVYDRDGNGSVTRDELKKLLRSVVVDTRRMLKTTLEYEASMQQAVAAAAGGNLSNTNLHAEHREGDHSVTMMQVSKKKKKKKGTPTPPNRVLISATNVAGEMNLVVDKENLLALLDGDGDSDIEEQLLTQLVDNAMGKHDLDGNGVLTLDEFEAWAGGTKFIDELLVHFKRGF